MIVSLCAAPAFMAEVHHMFVCPIAVPSSVAESSNSGLTITICCNDVHHTAATWLANASHIFHCPQPTSLLDTAVPASAGLNLSPTPQVSTTDPGDDMLKLSDIGADFDVEGGQDYLKEGGDEDEKKEMDEAGELSRQVHPSRGLTTERQRVQAMS